MGVLFGSNSCTRNCINSVENPAFYICCAFPVLCSKLQLLATMHFRHFELRFRNNVRRPVCPKTRLYGTDELFRYVMNA